MQFEDRLYGYQWRVWFFDNEKRKKYLQKSGSGEKLFTTESDYAGLFDSPKDAARALRVIRELTGWGGRTERVRVIR